MNVYLHVKDILQYYKLVYGKRKIELRIAGISDIRTFVQEIDGIKALETTGIENELIKYRYIELKLVNVHRHQLDCHELWEAVKQLLKYAH